MSISRLVEELNKTLKRANRISPIGYASQTRDLIEADVRENVVDELEVCSHLTCMLFKEAIQLCEGNIADICSAANLELGHSRATLSRTQSGASLIVSCESASRKLCRSIFAVINAIAMEYEITPIAGTDDAKMAADVRKLLFAVQGLALFGEVLSKLATAAIESLPCSYVLSENTLEEAWSL